MLAPTTLTQLRETIMTAMPTTLQQNGSSLTFTGPGRSSGSHLYLEMARGQLHELYLAQVRSTGPAFSIAVVAGNHALGQIQVDHRTLQGVGRLNVGQVILVEVNFAPNCGLQQAKAAWPITQSASNPTRQTRPTHHAPRRFGTLVEVNGSSGYLHEDQTRNRIFIRRNQLPFSAFRLGTRVSFFSSQNRDGLLCCNDVKVV